ncbi:isoaspartyl peptidase/L-asparaginase 1-like [Athalia rosae]|uniref:isoaspartyl peptidase/L-asparaginase 1-like n=1 Tax=Athalia rosae TaxID=37344 RepID=UPI002033AF58|nr:isoaspartyl peptidase/L-asparaginase 1-like [Athalia rosae]
MDASIMDGEKLEIGSVGAVSDIEHPISLAKFILKNYPNTVIVGEGTKNLSRCMHVPWVSKGNMVSPKATLALNLTSDSNPHLKYNVEDLESADLLKSYHSTQTFCNSILVQIRIKKIITLRKLGNHRLRSVGWSFDSGRYHNGWFEWKNGWKNRRFLFFRLWNICQ